MSSEEGELVHVSGEKKELLYEEYLERLTQTPAGKTMTKKLPVAANLDNVEYNILLQVYAHHNSSMTVAERENYSLSHIEKAEKVKDGVVLVSYNDGRIWYYTINGKFEEITL